MNLQGKKKRLNSLTTVFQKQLVGSDRDLSGLTFKPLGNRRRFLFSLASSQLPEGTLRPGRPAKFAVWGNTVEAHLLPLWLLRVLFRKFSSLASHQCLRIVPSAMRFHHFEQGANIARWERKTLTTASLASTLLPFVYQLISCRADRRVGGEWQRSWRSVVGFLASG